MKFNLTNSMHLTIFGRFKDNKIESKFQSSQYSGMYQNLPIIALVMALLDFHSLINLIYLITTATIWYKMKKKFYIGLLFRIIFIYLNMQQKEQSRAISLNMCASSVLIQDYRIQLLFLFLSLQNYDGFYILIFYAFLLRFIEFYKRKLFFKIYFSQQKPHEQEQIINQLPHHVLILDKGLNIKYSNYEWKQLQVTQESKKAITDAIKKRINKLITLEYLDKVQYEYHFKVEGEEYQLIQSQFPDNQVKLFSNLHNQINQIYKQLCQDYQKWNNLRAFKVIKESDLGLLGQCISDCRYLEHYLKTLDYLFQDLAFQKETIVVDFYFYNHIVNLIESNTTKLFEHFNIIELEFLPGIPEALRGNKVQILYLLQTFLFSAQFDAKRLIPKYEAKIDNRVLQIKVELLSVSGDKTRYELEFSIKFPCSPKFIQLYASLFKHGDYAPKDEQEQILIYMLQKAKSLILQSSSSVKFTTIDGDIIQIQYTVEAGIVSSIQLQNYETLSNQNTQILCENILKIDLNFTQILNEQNKYQWKAKSTDQQIMLRPQFDKSQTQRTEQSEGNEQQQLQDQKVSDYKVLYPQIKKEFLLILEDLIRQADQIGLIDKTAIHIFNPQSDRIKAQSEQADTEQLDSFQTSPRVFNTPQIRPRNLSSMAKESMQIRVGFTKRKAPKTGKKNTIYKQQNALFSPRVMSYFSSNLSKIIEKAGKQRQSGHNLGSLTSFYEDSKNQSFSHGQMFNSYIFKNRLLTHKRVWSHRINLDKIPEVNDRILCYVPNNKWGEVIKVFGNSMYKDKEIKEPYINTDIYECLRDYKKFMSEGQQFCFILIFIQKQLEALDFITTVKFIENQISQKFSSFKQSIVLGVYENPQQIFNAQFTMHWKQMFPLNINENQLKQQKDQIATLIK